MADTSRPRRGYESAAEKTRGHFQQSVGMLLFGVAMLTCWVYLVGVPDLLGVSTGSVYPPGESFVLGSFLASGLFFTVIGGTFAWVNWKYLKREGRAVATNILGPAR